MTKFPGQCPSCGSFLTDIVTVRNGGFSIGKAALGGALLGPIGALGGFAGKKKTTYKCQKCGRIFEE